MNCGKNENKILIAQEDRTLVGTKYLWLKTKSNFTQENKADFRNINTGQLSVGRAWNRKELLRYLWDYRYEGSARKFFNKGSTGNFVETGHII